MLAKRDAHSLCQQTVALAYTRLPERADYDEQDSSEEHAGEYDVSAIGLSASVGGSTFDDRKPEVQQTSDVDNRAVLRACKSKNMGAGGLSCSSPTYR